MLVPIRNSDLDKYTVEKHVLVKGSLLVFTFSKSAMETEQFAQIEICEIGSKLTMKTKTSDVVLVSLLLTLSIFQTIFQYSNC